MIIYIIVNTSRQNVIYGFGIFAILATGFALKTINSIYPEHEEYRKKMLEHPESRHLYYEMINI